jgi:hypothetical protein
MTKKAMEDAAASGSRDRAAWVAGSGHGPDRHDRSGAGSAPDCELEAGLEKRLEALIDEGAEIWHRFDHEVRGQHWHPFVAADYGRVLDALRKLRSPGLRFLEWGSATGIIAIMADLLGFEAYGIELDPKLVGIARDLARKYDSGARFEVGSFLPSGYTWRPRTGDGRQGTIGDGTSAYPALGHPLDDFDLVYAYPWSGEEPMLHDLMRRYGDRNARLLVYGTSGKVEIYTHDLLRK